MSDPPSPKTKRKVIHAQAREMAMRILQKCIEEKQANKFTYPISQALDRTAYYTGISKRTLAKIQREATKGPLRSPTRKGNTCDKYNNIKVDDFDRSVIHECIQEFYLNKKVPATGPKLLEAVKEKIDFPWGMKSFTKLLKQMGYEWQKYGKNRHILVENPDIVFARSQYLSKIRQFRKDGRNIFFLVETCLDGNLQFKKEPTPAGASAKTRLILVHAGASGRFLNGTNLLSATGKDNGDTFESWITTTLIPNLPPSSVIIMDNATDSVQKNYIPSKANTKTVMLNWLNSRDIKADPLMRNDELYTLIEAHKSNFEIGKIIENHGHEVLKLPPFMYDLNPIELAWANIKRFVAEQNTNSDLSATGVKNVAEIAVAQVNQVTEEDWLGLDNHVMIKEENYWQKDGDMETTMDHFVTNTVKVELGEIDEDGDSDSTMDSD